MVLFTGSLQTPGGAVACVGSYGEEGGIGKGTLQCEEFRMSGLLTLSLLLRQLDGPTIMIRARFVTIQTRFNGGGYLIEFETEGPGHGS